MKKIICLICMMALILGSLGGCGKDVHGDDANNMEMVETKAQDFTENADSIVLESETEVDDADTSNIFGGRDMGSATEISLNNRISSQVEQGQSAWYSFTTPMNIDGACTIGVVDKTPDAGKELYAVVYDSEENCILDSTHINSTFRGEISIGKMDNLEANTTYYIEIYEYHSHAAIDFMLVVYNGCLGDVLPVERDFDAEGVEVKNTNYDDVKKILNSGKLIKGTVTNNESAWFWFKTDEEKQAEYTISVTNRSTDLGSLFSLIGMVFDAEGTLISQVEANVDGMTQSISLPDLETGTVYRCCVYSRQGGGTIDYAIGITGGTEREEITDIDGEMEKYDAYATGDGTNQVEPICISNNTRIDGSVMEGRNSYLAFETPMEINGECKVVVANKTVNSYLELYFDVLDEAGVSVIGGDHHSGNYGYRGYPTTVTLNDVKPHKKYYIQIWEVHTHRSIDYMVKVIIPTTGDNEQTDIADNSAEVLGAASDPEPEKNTSIAQPIMLETIGTAYNGTIVVNDENTAGAAWFWFKTGHDTKGKYTVNIKNRTGNDRVLIGDVMDEYGNSMLDNRQLKAEKGRLKDSATITGLEADTVYYCELYAYNAYELDYTISINAKNSKAKKKENKKLVLSKPIELTNNQVMFMGGSEQFVNRDDVISVLKPIAKIMNKYPDHKFLLVGSTATAETEEYCLDLSERRANAVKNVLVNELNVSEKQLQIIGNGFSEKPFTRAKDRDENDRFIESEGAKNRRVIVVDSEHKAAKMLLQK